MRGGGGVLELSCCVYVRVVWLWGGKGNYGCVVVC